MPKLVADLAGRQAVARRLITDLNLTQHAYSIIIADINALNDWDDDMESNDIARDFNKLFSNLAYSQQGTVVIIPLRSKSELFYKLFVVWAMQSDESRIATLPSSIRTSMNGRPWWQDAMIEFGCMVRRWDVEIDWLDNLFQQFADEPPSKTKKRRQIANVAPADQPRLLQRTLVSAPQAAEDTPSSRKVGKRKQHSQVTSTESTNASSSSPAQPSKKIKSENPMVNSQSHAASATSSRSTDDMPPLRAPQQAIGTTSSGALSTVNFGLGLPSNIDTSNKSLAVQPGRDLVGQPQTKASPERDPPPTIDWHHKFMMVTKQRDDLACQLEQANKQLKEQEASLSELHKQLSPLLDSAHSMLQGLNAIDLQREKMRDAAIKFLVHSSYGSQQAAASTSTGNGHAASTAGNPESQSQSIRENGLNGTGKNGHQGTS